MAPSTDAPANADGVVVKSSAPNYAKGDIVKNGEAISLGPEQSISVLNPAGDLLTFTENSVFGEASTSERRDLSAWDAATWNERRTAIGGTRTQTYEECVALAETQSDLTEEACARIHLTPAEDAPALELKLLGNPQRQRAGGPMKLALQANFEAEVSCVLKSGEGADFPLLLGKSETGTVHLMNGTRTHIPKRGGTPFAAPQDAGSYKIACVAVQSQAVQIVQDAAGETEPDRDIAIKFAEISGAPVASAEISLTIID